MTPPASTRRASPTPSSDVKHAPLLEEDVTRSDGEGSGGEKPVREKLRDATLNHAQLKKKRSLQEIDGAEDSEDGAEKEGTRHRRKRSREAEVINKTETEREPTPDVKDENMEGSGIASPKGKRSREEARVAEAEVGVEASTPQDERKTKRVRDTGSSEAAEVMSEAASALQAPTTKLPSTSGFANTSAASPFGTLASKTASGAPESLPQTSSDKFKSSGFGSFATAAASPFGATAPRTTSAFGAPAATGAASPWAAKTVTPVTQPSAFAAAASSSSASGFGNTSSTSGFGGLGGGAKSGFGGGSSGFGGALGGSAFATLGGGSKLSTFATPSASAPKIEGLSGKPAKAFGASNDTDDEEDPEDTDADEEGAKSPMHESAENEKDKRFYKQHIETGEESETTVFQQRAKLYGFDRAAKKWVERGAGVLKLNITEVPTEEEEGKAKVLDAPSEDEPLSTRKIHARLLLRSDGSQRVVLNSPVVKGALFGDDTEPSGTNILFMGRLAGAASGDAGLVTLQIKMNAERAKVLWHHVQELQERLA